MKRVLVIAYYWPPSGGSGVQRWVKMCKYLPSQGWQPVVYTPSNPALTAYDNTLQSDVPPQVEVIRRPILEPGQFARKSTSAQVTPINSQKKSLKQRMAMWIRGNCFIPDPRVLWVRPSVRFLCEYLKGHPVDAIVSTGPPHSMHLIAGRVARKSGTPWVADFRDPWTKMFYFKHLSLSSWAERKHIRLELSVLDNASRIVAVSPLVQNDFRQMTSTPVELITNGFDSADFPAAPREKFTSEHFTLLHAGLFAADGNPLALWEALAQMLRETPGFAESFRLVLCGKTDAAVLQAVRDAGLEDVCTDLGYLDHTQVVKQMTSSSVLMLPLRREPEYKATLPGKLFEYLASRRPVMGIGQTDGAMAAILRDCKAGNTFDWEEAREMRIWLEEKFSLWQQGRLDDNRNDISLYSREGLARRYAQVLDEISR